jgi:DNA repair exonuclease SbcCD ATPase subunit
MDLHNLHRPTPSTTQQRSEPAPSGMQHAVHSYADTRADTDKLRAELAHWKHETEKMDRIARDAMDKLDRKTATKNALKAEFQAARRDADAWRSRYGELSAARSRFTDNEHALQSDLDKARRELDEARRTLQRNESEREDIKKWLKTGGEAHRKVQGLETQLTEVAARHKTVEAELTARHKTVEAELTARHKAVAAELAQAVAKGKTMEADLARIKAQAVSSIKTLEAELAAAKTQAAARTRQVDLDAAKARQAESDLVAARDKLRAATHDASAKTAQAHACQDMLARAEQVLQTCCSLHSAKDDAHPLAMALRETTQTIGQFLKQHER